MRIKADGAVSGLLRDVTIPRMFRARQSFPKEKIEPQRIPQLIRELLSAEPFRSKLRPGMDIAITAGSRGIANVALHPSLIAMYLGLIRMLAQIPLPSFVDGAIDGLGGCTSPMAMALVGAILADSKFATVFSRKAFYLVAVRQLMLPLLCLLGLRLAGADELVLGVSVVLSAMPIGSTTAILAQKYGADASFASKCVFASTLLSLITVPLITLLL